MGSHIGVRRELRFNPRRHYEQNEIELRFQITERGRRRSQRGVFHDFIGLPPGIDVDSQFDDPGRNVSTRTRLLLLLLEQQR